VSAFYQAVGWNRQKRLYDTGIAAGVLCYLLLFIGVGARVYPDATAETLSIRALGSAAFLLLTIVLCIGPLTRVDRRFLPLLYNRRHLGVATFTVSLAHATFALVQFHSQGNVNPLLSVLTGNPRVNDLGQFPFELLGLAALGILFLLAATSHDFWLANLTGPVWKTLHMMVYLAYTLLVFHVALGVLQTETSPVLSGALAAGAALVIGLHLMAGWGELQRDGEVPGALEDGWVDVCAVEEIPNNRGRVACIGGERLAVFRYDGRVSCVSNVCQHQNGPLGEGKVVDGLITCPWHGYQYRPDTGASPAPFTEKIPTFRVRVVGDRIQVDPRPNPAGTKVEPAVIQPQAHG